MNVVGGNTQSAPVNTRLPNPVRVRVLNSSGQPVANFLLDFAVTSGGGSVFGGAELTDAQGYADEQWTLGPRLGPQTLEAREVNPNSGVAAAYGKFAATGTPPNDVLVVGNNGTGIFVMNANGSDLKQVLTTGARDYSPSLSPDHSQIVFFSSSRVPDSVAVFLMTVTGTNIHQIGPALYTFMPQFPPQWNPNDSLIIYAGQPTGAPDIVPNSPADCCAPGVLVVDTFGNLVSQQYFEEDEAGPGAWTATGGNYIFWCDQGCFEYAGLSYSDSPQILGGPASWYVNAIGASPDGQHIAFVGAPATSGNPPTYLYTMNTDGTNVTQLTSATGLGNQLSYSPDGTIIAVDHGFINADGTDYQVIQGCPCAFAPTSTTFSAGPSQLPRMRIHRHAPRLTTAAVRRLILSHEGDK
jgi:hypothetical protein